MPEEQKTTETGTTTKVPPAIVNADGSFTENWRDSLGDELKADKTLEAVPDFPTAMKMLVHSQKLVGTDKVALPTEHSTEEERAEFFSKLGKPEKPEGYELTMPAELPEGVIHDEQLEGAYRQAAHKTDLSVQQAKELYDWYNTAIIEKAKQDAQVTADVKRQAFEKLHSDWGQSYEDKVKLAKSAIVAFADKEAVEVLDGEIGNKPALIRMLMNVGKAIGEGGLKGPAAQTFSITDLQAEINKLQADPAYMDGRHPQHKEIVERVRRLYEDKHRQAG